MIIRDIPNPQGGTYRLRAYTWDELEAYLRKVDLGPVKPLELYLHHTYRPVAPASSTLNTIIDLTAGVLRYFWNQGWRPFGKGPHIFAGPPGAVVAWPVRLDGYHVVYHNYRTLGVEMMFDGEAGPIPAWAREGWIRIARALTANPGSGITQDRKHLRLHRDYTAGTTEADRMIDLAGADFTRYASRKSCPGRKVLEQQIYPALWSALEGGTAGETDEDMILLPVDIYPSDTKAAFAAGTTYDLYRIVNGQVERRKFTPGVRTWFLAGAKVTLNGDAAHAGVYLLDGPHAGWIVSGWGELPVVRSPQPIDVEAAVLAATQELTAKIDKAVTVLTT